MTLLSQSRSNEHDLVEGVKEFKELTDGDAENAAATKRRFHFFTPW